MTSPRDTICALSTAPGHGALAVVRLSGPAARAIAATLTGRAADSFVDRRATLARVRAARGVVDDVVLTLFSGPRSYSGEDLVELSCHGNPLVAQATVEAALAAGARPAEPGELTPRAFI
ncbi:MAG: tRNA uridine-5-carboxymethylaminomethyl(34) synthesis GTPase MnmE, partial [Myxococcales bacterium]|nr:tRNA uridine-5-carboxymethylaminomethyl(34) synthesis GTPase MnmE [Myxococcales bacterium]